MTYRVSATLDAESEAALYSIMKRTGWNKSQVLREAIWAAAGRRGLARKRAVENGAANKVKVKI
jgi:hypothetical protein